MDKRFLDKVVDMIVSETTIDHDEERVYPPNSNDTNSYSFPAINFNSLFFLRPPLYSFPLPLYFFNHCRDVYGLNNEESKYVWEEYKRIIINKIKNNG